MNTDYIEKVKEIRILANGGENYFQADKDKIPGFIPEVMEMYEDLRFQPEFRSIKCAEVIAFLEYYEVTIKFLADFSEIYERFKVFADSKRYVEILKDDNSGVDKREQATQIFKALNTIPDFVRGHAKDYWDKSLLPICAVLVTQMFYDFGDALAKYFFDDSVMMALSVKAWKEGIRRQTQWKYWRVNKKNLNMEKMEEYAKKIKNIDSAYSIPKPQSIFSVWWNGLEE